MIFLNFREGPKKKRIHKCMYAYIYTSTLSPWRCRGNNPVKVALRLHARTHSLELGEKVRETSAHLPSISTSQIEETSFWTSAPLTSAFSTREDWPSWRNGGKNARERELAHASSITRRQITHSRREVHVCIRYIFFRWTRDRRRSRTQRESAISRQDRYRGGTRATITIKVRFLLVFYFC